MAFTTPITWTINQLVSVANMNEQVRDNMNAVWQAAAVRITHSANQSIADSALTALAFNTERFDQAAGAASTMHDPITNNTRLTCRISGVYMIGANIDWSSLSTAGYRQLSLRVTGTTTIAHTQTTAVGSAIDTTQNINALYSLTSGTDYVEVMVYQNSGAALGVQLNANFSPEFWMVRVG